MVKVEDRYGNEITVGSTVLVAAYSRHSGMEERIVQAMKLETRDTKFSTPNPNYDPTQPYHYQNNPPYIWQTGPADFAHVKAGKIVRSGSAPQGSPIITVSEVVVVDSLK